MATVVLFWVFRARYTEPDALFFNVNDCLLCFKIYPWPTFLILEYIVVGSFFETTVSIEFI